MNNFTRGNTTQSTNEKRKPVQHTITCLAEGLSDLSKNNSVFTFWLYVFLLALMPGFVTGQAYLRGTGGTVTQISVSGTPYIVHTFTSTGTSTFTPPYGVSSVEYLVVAGGGGGGNSVDRTGGGGGAGGVRSGTSYAVTVQGYTITVGSGGAANTAGNNSVFATLTSIGGGRGGQVNSTSTTGGSGGGAYHNPSDAGSNGTAGQGNAGGDGYDGGGTINQFGAGGGGGQSQAGADGVYRQAGKGGNGYTSLISGTSKVYAGGGGGGYQRLSGTGGAAGAGGTGGGGAGSFSTSNTSAVNGTSGTANSGGGGGGAAGGSGGVGGAGGSGIVIIRYKAPVLSVFTQPSTSVCSGNNFAQPAVIRLVDGNGSAVSGVTVTAGIKTGTGGSLTNTTANTDGNGYAAFANLRLSGIAGNFYTLNFLATGSTQEVVSGTITITGGPVASVTNKNDINCNSGADGSVTISATGGAAPYSYSVDNGGSWESSANNPYVFSGLSANEVYKIRVKDSNGCESPTIP